MRDYSIQNKKAWEFDAYEFWIKQSGTPEERAAEDIKDPIGMLRKYSQYFDSYATTIDQPKAKSFMVYCVRERNRLDRLGEK